MSELERVIAGATKRHQAIVESAVNGDRTARANAANELSGLLTEFWRASLPLAGVAYPYQLDLSNKEHATIKAVAADIRQSETVLRTSSDGSAIQKRAIELKNMNYVAFPRGLNVNFTVAVVAVIVALMVAIWIRR